MSSDGMGAVTTGEPRHLQRCHDNLCPVDKLPKNFIQATLLPCQIRSWNVSPVARPFP